MNRGRGARAARFADLELKVGRRDIRYVAQAVRVSVAVSADGLVYDDLRFHGHGGRFSRLGHRPVHAARAGRSSIPVADARGTAARRFRARALLVLEPRPDLVIPDSSRAVGKLVITDHLAVFLSLRTGRDRARGECRVPSRSAPRLDGGDGRPRGCVVDRVRPSLSGLVTVDADMHDTTIRGVVSSTNVQYPPFVLEDASVLRSSRHRRGPGNRLDARIADGISSFGVLQRSGEVLARVSAAAIAVHELPPIEAGEGASADPRQVRAAARLARRPSSEASPARRSRPTATSSSTRRRSPSSIARGRALVTASVHPTGRHRPAVATVRVDPTGLPTSAPSRSTCTAPTSRGHVDLLSGRALDGHVEIVLEEEYLRTSKLLTLPRVFGERLVIPIRLGGTTGKPDVHAELGQAWVSSSATPGSATSSRRRWKRRSSSSRPAQDDDAAEAGGGPDREARLGDRAERRSTRAPPDWAVLATRR